MELTLTPRLETVACLVPQGACLADVGTDHAYLPVRLLLDGRVERAIAADLREGRWPGPGRLPGAMAWRTRSPSDCVTACPP